jgi:tetratricopeptide (TPR) repeat protein
MRISRALIIIIALCNLTGFGNSPDAAHYMELGSVAQAEGRPEEALELYSRGIDLAPDKSAYYMKRGFLLLKMTHREEALRDFSTFIELEPTSSQGYMSRGMLNSELGRKSEALLDFNRACKLGDQGGCNFAGAEEK